MGYTGLGGRRQVEDTAVVRSHGSLGMAECDPGTGAWQYQLFRFVTRSQQSGFLRDIFRLLDVGN